MPRITLTGATAATIAAIARPGDTPKAVVTRAVAALAATEGPVSLQFARILDGDIDGTPLPGRFLRWNGLMYHMIDLTCDKYGAGAGHMLFSHKVYGHDRSHGMRYFKKGKISVQGQNADRAWKEIATCAVRLGLKLNLRCVWGPQSPRAGQEITLSTFQGVQ